jgi:hypothetical protein
MPSPAEVARWLPELHTSTTVRRSEQVGSGPLACWTAASKTWSPELLQL